MAAEDELGIIEDDMTTPLADVEDWTTNVEEDRACEELGTTTELERLAGPVTWEVNSALVVEIARVEV